MMLWFKFISAESATRIFIPHEENGEQQNILAFPDMKSSDGSMPSDRRSKGWRLSDVSAFHGWGTRAAGILSGLDCDGSAALQAIKHGGGATFAQSGAAFDSMPRSAVETGDVDRLLPASGIAKALLEPAHRSLVHS